MSFLFCFVLFRFVLLSVVVEVLTFLGSIVLLMLRDRLQKMLGL